ncbi:MAG: hypothetical protein K9M45_07785, partial [Kiritimatiellales bacterium]|nr:hypothetical protein [Kiritimatiellales bacterium]
AKTPRSMAVDMFPPSNIRADRTSSSTLRICYSSLDLLNPFGAVRVNHLLAQLFVIRVMPDHF